MPIENAQLAQFCNAELRQVADQLERLKIRTAAATAIYYARNLGTVIDSAGASNTVDDGADEDGRTIVTGGDVYNIVGLLNDLTTFLNADRQQVISKWNVNGHKG
jgi:Flp pilus assembly CpaE family ATPase